MQISAVSDSKTLHAAGKPNLPNQPPNTTLASAYTESAESMLSPPNFPDHSVPNLYSAPTARPPNPYWIEGSGLTSTLTSQSTPQRQSRGGAPASMYAAAARSAPPLPFTASDTKPRPRASVSSPEQFRPSACARLEARASPSWTGPAARRDPRGPARESASATTAQPPRRAAAGADRGRSARRGAAPE
jgi:hypothetical protein